MHLSHRQSLNTVGSLEKTKKLKSSKIVQISAQRNLFGQLLILSGDSNLSLQKVLQYPIGSTLATPDGLPVKTDKAKLMHQLEDLDAYVVEGNALLQALTALPQTFGELSETVQRAAQGEEGGLCDRHLQGQLNQVS